MPKSEVARAAAITVVFRDMVNSLLGWCWSLVVLSYTLATRRLPGLAPALFFPCNPFILFRSIGVSPVRIRKDAQARRLCYGRRSKHDHESTRVSEAGGGGNGGDGGPVRGRLRPGRRRQRALPGRHHRTRRHGELPHPHPFDSEGRA